MGLDDVGAAVIPEVVVRTGDVGFAVGVAAVGVVALPGLLRVFGGFGVGQYFFRRQLAGAFQGSHCGAGPDSLQVRMTIGRALAKGRGLASQVRDQHRASREKSMAHG
jgi:hypothetical protein